MSSFAVVTWDEEPDAEGREASSKVAEKTDLSLEESSEELKEWWVERGGSLLEEGAEVDDKDEELLPGSWGLKLERRCNKGCCSKTLLCEAKKAPKEARSNSSKKVASSFLLTSTSSGVSLDFAVCGSDEVKSACWDSHVMLDNECGNGCWQRARAWKAGSGGLLTILLSWECLQKTCLWKAPKDMSARHVKTCLTCWQDMSKTSLMSECSCDMRCLVFMTCHSMLATWMHKPRHCIKLETHGMCCAMLMLWHSYKCFDFYWLQEAG